VKVGSNPKGIAISPEGTKVFAADEGSSSVSVIDTATNNVTATVNAGNGPVGVALGQFNFSL
jgi:YVTN family beta-propeller protein